MPQHAPLPIVLLLAISLCLTCVLASQSLPKLQLHQFKPLIFEGDSYFSPSFPSPNTHQLDLFNSLDQIVQGPAFSVVNDPTLLVALTDGIADAQISYVFVPKDNFTIDDYRLTPQIANPNILDQNDVSIFTVETTLNGLRAYNVTADIDFNKWVGISQFQLLALNRSTSTLEASSTTTEITVVGITFYRDQSGTLTLYGGPNFPLDVATTDIISNNDVNLNVFIQYFDGSTSNTSLLVPLSGIAITTAGIEQEINYTATCSPTLGTYDGSDVQLSQPCGMAFSTNLVDGVYVGPHYGFDFNPYRNGSFTSSFEFNELVEGSDLEPEGYTTFIDVNVIGEVPPLVTSVFPDGPFGSLGTEKVTLNVQNLPSSLDVAELWTYALSINFGGEIRFATFDTGSIVVNANGTLSITFTVPAGVGSNLPWTLVVTKPDGSQLTAIDQTNPSYLFTFIDRVSISSITPSEGPEAGGTDVTLVGEFPNFDAASSVILFGSTQIDSSLISESSTSSITFTTPSRESVGDNFSVSVTVVIGENSSNGVTFTYIPSVILTTLAPDFGPSEGGTNVTLTGQFSGFDLSVDSGVFFGSTRIDSSLILFFNDTTVVFSSPPQTSVGSADVFTYDVSVQVDGERSNSIPFSYEADVVLNSITPNSGPIEGGTSVTLQGQFIGFDRSTSNVIIGGKTVDDADLVSFSDSSIVFITPPLSEVGSSFTQGVRVVIRTSSSESLLFTYEDRSTQVVIEGSGGTTDASGTYNLGACADGVFRALISNGARFQNPVYQWTLIDQATGVEVLSAVGITANAEIVYIPYQVLRGRTGPFVLRVLVSTDFSSFDSSLSVVQLGIQNIGVRIIDQRSRSLSDPNTTLTIPSDIGAPGCLNTDFQIDSAEMTFVWVYRGATYVFSHLNETAPEDIISPTLLGREFNIPQLLLEYGTFSVSLTAFFTQNSSIRGSDGSILVIEPAPLIAQINGGETSQLVSETQSFVMSALESRDPDVLIGDQATGLSFDWSCRLSWSDSFADAQVCDSSLLPSATSSSFEISSESFVAVQNETSRMFIEYSLLVRKTSQNATGFDISRVSSTTTSTLILSQETAQSFESLREISVVNNQSSLIDRNSVKYYEDITITPISETEDTSWTFELLAPASEIRTLLSSDSNLIPLPGYFTAGSEAGRLSLGLRANVLSPNTQYQFLISTFRVGFSVNEQVVELTTVEQPTVSISNLATPTGTTNSTFILSATTSYAGDFKFFFLLKDEFSFETCVGGCQGVDTVRFRLATAGTYAIRCDVYDSLGFTLLASAEGGSIVVTSEIEAGSDLSAFSGDADDAFLAGDHAEYQQLGTDMVRYILSTNGTSSAEMDSEVLANFTRGLNQVSGNAVPNAIQSAGYVRTAAALASLTPNLGVVYNTETLFFLVNITINSIQRTPDNAALQQLNDLLDFYSLTPALVLASYPEGTSRRRLLQTVQDNDDDLRRIWLDMFEVLKEQITVTALKRCTCGCEVEISTGVRSESNEALNARLLLSRQVNENGSNLTAAAQYVNPSQGEISEVKMKMAHYCNSEQGTELFINQGTEDEIRFEWCKEIFEDTIKKLYFAVAQTPDYVYLSRLRQTNVTLNDGLVSTMVVQVLGNNSVVDATLAIANCYNVRMSIPEELSVVADDSPIDEVPSGLLLAPRQRFGNNLTSELYLPIFGGIITEIGNSDATQGTNKSAVTLTLSNTGVLAVATRIAWGGAFFSLDGIFLLAFEIVGVTLIMLVLVAAASLGAWFIATRTFAGVGGAAPVEADFTFVERDVYGRGTAVDIAEAQDAAALRG